MTSKIQPIIMCGGAGTRLWPASRGQAAKQFLPLVGETSLFRQSLDRVPQDQGFAAPLVICGTGHVDAVRAQMGDHAVHLLIEPAPRGTAAAIALAVARADPQALLLVMPSDHVIADVAAFHAAIAQAAPLARDDRLVTFGITPDRPETGFGYIAAGAPLGTAGFAVDHFVEKPPLDKAQAMLAAGSYSWNAGIFLFRAGHMQAALETHCPAIWQAAAAAVAQGREEADAFHADADAFTASPNQSIDYAVMEKADRVAVVPVAMGWSDLGSWHAVHALSPQDGDGNAQSGDVIFHDSRGNLVHAGGKRVALVGVEDLAVVVDGDDILIIPLARAQQVRAIAQLRGD
ncbi:mannose-1-phosphate guanylyltransferase [Sphingopyxis sp. MWB1]|uniref:mannose-1-phosphate guanylyltransferase n=1 Tax=Sphingopyxis sp. MWB1 TaxID=1537715 RepID=UPI00051A3ED2|nr:sugar phosphate nucleotidyltransferase [Sphingopyxis sp. MWB1]